MLHGFRLLFNDIFGIVKDYLKNKQIIVIVPFKLKHALGLFGMF